MKRKGWASRRFLFVCFLIGFTPSVLGCGEGIAPGKILRENVLKRLTVIRGVRVAGDDGGARVEILGDSPFSYRIFTDSRLGAVVVRIPDSIYDDEQGGLEKSFPDGPISRFEVVQRKTLIQTVEIRLHPRDELPSMEDDPDFRHSMTGSDLVITWGGTPERGSPSDRKTRSEKLTEQAVQEARTPEPAPRKRPPARSGPILPNRALLPSLRTEDYQVGRKDTLKIVVFREEDLSGEYTVASDGTVNFPLLGRVQVQGKTTAQIEKRLETLLGKDFLVNPTVSIKVTEFRSQQVQLLGAVMKPGTYSLRAPTTILEIISQGGGIDPSEGGGKAVVLRPKRTRDGEDEFITIDLNTLLRGADLTANIMLRGSDTVYVPRADSIFVFGQVKSPGPYKIQDRKITVAEAVSKAGGLTRLAAPNRTRVVRVAGGTEQVIQVRLDDILKGDLSKDILLVAEDIIFVPESFF